MSWEANIPSDLWSIRFGLQPQWVVLTMEASLGSEHSYLTYLHTYILTYLTYWLFVFWSWLKFFSSQKKMMWFVLAGLLLARKAFSTAAQVAYTVLMVFNIMTVCLHYVILEMHSFQWVLQNISMIICCLYILIQKLSYLSSAPCI